MKEARSTEFDVECLFCGLVQVAHSSMEGETPSPGDICICFDCGYVAAYAKDLKGLVPLTKDQQDFIETSPSFKNMMLALRIIKDQNRKG